MDQPISPVETPARLITIPVSHYCEKIRWALTRLQIPFVEERHMPPFHRFATRQLGQQLSPKQVTETERNLSPMNRFVSRIVGGQSVPVLVTGTDILRSSEEILKYIDAIAPDRLKLYPTDPQHRQKVEELVTSFDSVLGPLVRQWTYSYLMDQPNLIKPLWCQGVPWFERQLFPVVFPWMRSNVLQMYDISDASAIAAHAQICEIFAAVGNLLADGRSYLVGNRFSAADLTFATLAAAVVVPEGYGVKLPDLDRLPFKMTVSIQSFRETVAGKCVLRLYEEHTSNLKSSKPS
jgi:glutathione S-transferase